VYYRYINLPKIPDDILKLVNFNFDEYEEKAAYNGIYVWSDSFNRDINQWCRENICDTMYWGFQIIKGDLALHKDIGTKTKFIYLLQSGGDQVTTEFYEDDKTTLVESVVFETHRWHILKADSFHRVINVEPGKTRFSITGRIF
jgi:hypothetical protein